MALTGTETWSGLSTRATSTPRGRLASHWYATVGKSSDVTTTLGRRRRSEEHTSELQSQSNLVCRLLLEKKKKNDSRKYPTLHGSHQYNTPTVDHQNSVIL